MMIYFCTKKFFIFSFILIFWNFSICAQQSSIHDCINDDFSNYFGRSEEVMANLVLHVDLRDVVEHYGASFPEAKTMLTKITDKENYFFPGDVDYLSSGPRKNRERNQIYGLEIKECPFVLDDRVEFHIQAFYQWKGSFYYQIFYVHLDRKTSQVTYLISYKNSIWENRKLKIEIFSLERKVFLTQSNGNIIKIYPIAVGGFDEAVLSNSVSLVTPHYRNAYLNLSVSQRSRNNPNYFKGRPFLRISTQNTIWTPIGLHIKQNAKLRRGFESHGCIRMREKDLYELYQFLVGTSDGKIPLSITHTSTMAWDHPYPTIEDSYNTITRPPRRDQDGLMIMHRVYAMPPIHEF